jgi:NAD(P)-dependent dehydrogenase (short-subunit alcohol dehydrogenase family)
LYPEFRERTDPVNHLEGKVVLITGAKGGLGSFVTAAFLEAGASVVGVSRSIQAGDFAHRRFTAMPAELSSGAAALQLAGDAVARFQRIDGLVHVMGGFAGGTRVEETDDATMERMLDLNFRSAFFMLRAVLPYMRQQGKGSIAVVASRQGVEPGAMVGAYSASKAAVVALVRTVALENRDRAITANVVLPGAMDTPGNRANDPKADGSQWVQPAQVASLLVHLASDSGAGVTGAAIPVYGRQL